MKGLGFQAPRRMPQFRRRGFDTPLQSDRHESRQAAGTPSPVRPMLGLARRTSQNLTCHDRRQPPGAIVSVRVVNFLACQSGQCSGWPDSRGGSQTGSSFQADWGGGSIFEAWLSTTGFGNLKSPNR